MLCPPLEPSINTLLADSETANPAVAATAGAVRSLTRQCLAKSQQAYWSERGAHLADPDPGGGDERAYGTCSVAGISGSKRRYSRARDARARPVTCLVLPFYSDRSERYAIKRYR